MSSAISRHPDEETLLRLTDQDLSASEAGGVEEHLAGCDRCRGELAALRETLDEFRRFHENVLKPALPDPPREWGQPDWRALARREPRTRRVIGFPLRPALAAAAAIVAAVVVVRWIERPVQVSAAELLRKAEVQERVQPNTRRRIRIRWRDRSWTRPGRLGARVPPAAGDAAVLQGMLESAGFNWEDPLSAAAFSQWRERLSERRDGVQQQAEAYIVTTSTAAGVLREASLTLRANDLHPVSAKLTYRSEETLDMTELPGDAGDLGVGIPHVPTPQSIPHPAGAPPVAGPAEEVEVVAALHGIGADLGEPIQVQRGPDGILVSGAGLDASRQEQIRTAVAGVPGVRVIFEASGSRRPSGAELLRRTTAPSNAINPLLEQLRARGGNAAGDPGDALIEASDRAAQRAYALAALAERFPAAVERSLGGGDQVAVRGIAIDHLNALSTSVDDMVTLFAPLLPPLAPAATSTANWQESAGSVLAAARELDQELNATSADDLAERTARLAATLARLQGLIETARSQLQ